MTPNMESSTLPLVQGVDTMPEKDLNFSTDENGTFLVSWSANWSSLAT